MNAILVYLVASVALAAGAFYEGHSIGTAAVRLEWVEASQQQRDREIGQQKNALIKLEKTREQNRVVYRNVTKILDRVEYRSVCLDERGLCIANAFITGKDATVCSTVKPLSGHGTSTRWYSPLAAGMDSSGQ